MQELLEKIKILEDGFRCSSYTSYLSFFVSHSEFPAIWQMMHQGTDPIRLGEFELLRLENFCKKIFPLSCTIAKRMPLENYQNIYRPYVEKIFNGVRSDIFYNDENLKKIYKALSRIDPTKTRENHNLIKKIKELKRKLGQLDQSFIEYRKTELQTKKKSLEGDIEQRKQRKNSLDKGSPTSNEPSFLGKL